MEKHAKNFAANESGAVSIIAALGMVAVLGLAALALDIGHLVSVKSELQKAADAGAMSGARALWPQILPISTSPPSPDCTQAQTKALDTLTKNQADNANLTGSQVTIQVGRWEYATRTFTPGCASNANAVRVTTAKNGISMSFAQILGIAPPNATGSAIAVMDFVKQVGKGSLPIAINDPFAVPGQELVINFTPDPLDNGGWFADPPDRASAATFKDYILNDSCPPLSVGDIINLQNGQDTSVLKTLKDELATHPGGWDTFLPVVDTDKFNQSEPIIAFCPFRILEVNDHGNPKFVRGKVLAMAITSGSAMPGGGNKGALAPPKMVN